jgi:uncharacterized membrane protein (TIGR02234 family)
VPAVPAVPARARRPAWSAGRQYSAALLGGAVGAGLILLAVRQQWARAVFTPPKPMAAEVIGVSGLDLVPVAGALALAALACLAVVIATRGLARRVTGVLLALFGAGAAIAVATSVSAASVLSVAESNVGSPAAAAASGAVGSTTSGSTGSGSSVVSLVGTTGHAIMNGTPWRLAVLAGALIVVAAGVATAWRGPRWPVMSSRYELHPKQEAGQASPAEGAPAPARDSASMWESLSSGADPTDASLH